MTVDSLPVVRIDTGEDPTDRWNRLVRRWFFICFSTAVAVMLATAVLRNISWQGPPDATPSATTVAETVLDIPGILQQQAHALETGDLAGWLAPVDPGHPEVLTLLRDQFHSLRAFGVTSFQPVFDGTAMMFAAIAKGDADLTIYFGYCDQVSPCPNADPDLRHDSRARPATPHFSAHITWHESRGRYLIVGYELKPADIGDSSREPWLDTKMEIRAGSKVTVAATADLAGRLPQAVAAADAAAAVADRYARLVKPTRYIVYLANATQWKTWFGGQESDPDRVIEGYAAETSQGSDIVVLNMAALDKYDDPLTDILRHEFGHVVTLLGRPYPGGSYLLTEGIADYVEQDGRSISSYPRLFAVQQFIHSGRWNGDIDQVEDYFYGNNAKMDILYGIGYLTWRCIADTYGQDKMFAFANDALRDKGAVRGAINDLGKSWDAVKRGCASYIRSAVR